MARIKIDLPEQFSFITEMAIRITDLNYGGHVGNDTVLSIIHEARVQFLKSHDYSELDFAGTSLIMGDVAIEFKKEIFYGDVIKASVKAAEFSRIGFDLFYKLEKEENGKEVTVAIAKTGMVCFNYQSKKIATVPAEAAERLIS